MDVLVFGSNGMVGGGVLRECLEDPLVTSVLAVGRRPSGLSHAKLRDVVLPDPFDLRSVAEELRDFDACLYCLGVSSTGMSEADYTRITYDLTVAIMDVVTEMSPDVTICFVSGQGTDGSEAGRSMWARVKGRAENHLLALEQEAYMFRPGFIQPLNGVRSGTALYQAIYTVLGPVSPLLKRLFPGSVTTSVHVGRAMIRAARHGYPERILETRDINELGGDAAA